MREVLETATEWLHGVFGLPPWLQRRLLSSLAAIFVLWALRRIVLAIGTRRAEDPRALYRWHKTTSYAFVPLGILVVGRIWFEGFGSIATFLGLLSAGVAIALKDLLVNLAGWGFILWRRPFVAGDRIQIGEHIGDVVDIRIFQFSLLEVGNWVDAEQSTGRLLHVPNGMVLSHVLANYTKGFQYIWNELPVLITFESNWEKAKTILTDIVNARSSDLSKAAQEQIKQVSNRFIIHYQHLTPIVYTSVAESGILLTIRHLCEPRRRRGTTQDIWEEILRRFGACKDIQFAYPTKRLFDNRSEGKPGAQAGAPGAPVAPGPRG
jgi:small-conductance mechanosensitive channel